MNVLKRAYIYIIRQKLRSFILFLVLLIIGTFVITGLSIKNNAKTAVKDVRETVNGTINLSTDDSFDNYELVPSEDGNQQYQYNGDMIGKDTIDEIMKIPGVIDCNAEDVSSLFASAVGFKYLPTKINEMGEMSSMLGAGDSTMSTVMNSEKFTGFTSGKLKLEQGRHITKKDENVIMIPKELAEYNNLSVGDKVKLYAFDKEVTLELEIIGIFSGTEGVGNNDPLLPSDLAGNQGIVDYKSKEDAYGEQYGNYGNVNIYVEDPVDIQNVYDKISESSAIKGKTFTLNINNEQYNSIEEPLESLQGLVNIIIIIVIVVSVVVLTLLLTLWIKDRQKEIGILMSIGINKYTIIRQFTLEIMLIAILSLGLSYFTSGTVADKASDYLVDQVNNEETDNSQIDTNVPLTAEDIDQLTGKSNETAKIPKFNVSTSTQDLLWVYVIGFIVIIGSTCLASYTVIKQKPKEILTKVE
ncbi:MAG: ABC transporter permease [Coprobacillaceae bacterium]